MKLLGIWDLSDEVEKIYKLNTKTIFIRLNPYPLNETIKYIFNELSDLSWINRYDKNILRKSIEERTNITVIDIEQKLLKCKEDIIASEAGEYIISILGKQALVNNLNYLNIPLAELWKEKKSGNPGFDFHSESIENKLIFGEAKYVCGKNAYNNALSQINDFINLNKDLMEIVGLDPLVSDISLDNFEEGRKGYAAAFSSNKIDNNILIRNILENENTKKLLNYDELILVAVDINE